MGKVLSFSHSLSEEFDTWSKNYEARSKESRDKGKADGLSDTADTTDTQVLRNSMRTAWHLAKLARDKAGNELTADEASFESYYWTAYGSAIYNKIYPDSASKFAWEVED